MLTSFTFAPVSPPPLLIWDLSQILAGGLDVGSCQRQHYWSGKTEKSLFINSNQTRGLLALSEISQSTPTCSLPLNLWPLRERKLPKARMIFQHVTEALGMCLLKAPWWTAALRKWVQCVHQYGIDITSFMKICPVNHAGMSVLASWQWHNRCSFILKRSWIIPCFLLIHSEAHCLSWNCSLSLCRKGRQATITFAHASPVTEQVM